jgi:ankyrin repeat protein
MPNRLGFPALVNASRGNHNMPDDPARVIALLNKGANVNITDHKGKTALHRAAQAGFVKISEVLINHGANIEAKDADGETPLFDAVKSAREDTVRLLVQHGASATTANKRGRSVMDYATDAKRPAIRAMASVLTSGASK